MSHLQSKDSASRILALESQLADVKQANARLEEDVRLLKEELRKQ